MRARRNGTRDGEFRRSAVVEASAREEAGEALSFRGPSNVVARPPSPNRPIQPPTWPSSILANGSTSHGTPSPQARRYGRAYRAVHHGLEVPSSELRDDAGRPWYSAESPAAAKSRAWGVEPIWTFPVLLGSVNAFMPVLTDRQRLELAVPAYLIYTLTGALDVFVPADPDLAARAEADVAELRGNTMIE